MVEINKSIEQMVWHPVDLRLPKTGERVIVSDGKFVSTGYLRDLKYHKKPERVAKWAWGNSVTDEVTHWMPMPQAPRSLVGGYLSESDDQ